MSHPEVSMFHTCVDPDVSSELAGLLKRLSTVRARVRESTPVDIPIV